MLSGLFELESELFISNYHFIIQLKWAALHPINNFTKPITILSLPEKE